MGRQNDGLAAIDGELHIHGLEGPRMISANLNASTLMIAEKASDTIQGRHALEPVLLSQDD